MKKFRLLMMLFLGMAATGMVFTSCDDDDPPAVIEGPYELEVQKTASIKWEGETITINVTTDAPLGFHAEFVKENDYEWFTLNKNSEKTFTVKAAENELDRDRTARVKVEVADTEAKYVAITQAKNGQVIVNTLEVDDAPMVFTYNQTEGITRDVETDAETFLADRGDDDWIIITPTATSFTVTVRENTGAERNGKITVTAGNAEPVEITVTQDEVEVKNTLTIDRDDELTFDFDYDEEFDFTIGTNADSWDAQLEDEDDDWIILRKDTPEKRLYLSLEENDGEEREGSFIITAGNANPITVKVTQRAFEGPKNTLVVDDTPIDIPFNYFGIFSYNIETDYEIPLTSSDIKSSASWVSINFSRVASNHIWLTFTPNTGAQRTATVTFTAGNADPVVVNITQGAVGTIPNPPVAMNVKLSISAEDFAYEVESLSWREEDPTMIKAADYWYFGNFAKDSQSGYRPYRMYVEYDTPGDFYYMRGYDYPIGYLSTSIQTTGLKQYYQKIGAIDWDWDSESFTTVYMLDDPEDFIEFGLEYDDEDWYEFYWTGPWLEIEVDGELIEVQGIVGAWTEEDGFINMIGGDYFEMTYQSDDDDYFRSFSAAQAKERKAPRAGKKLGPYKATKTTYLR